MDIQLFWSFSMLFFVFGSLIVGSLGFVCYNVYSNLTGYKGRTMRGYKGRKKR